MDNIKRGFILIFALLLSFAPLVICWYLPLNEEFNPLAIFYYIFQDSPAKNVISRGKRKPTHFRRWERPYKFLQKTLSHIIYIDRTTQSDCSKSTFCTLKSHQ